MIKKKISYIDFNGMQRDEEFYFHLSTPEIVKLELKFGGTPMAVYTQNLIDNGDADKLTEFIMEILISSYGKKTPDGKSFIKNAKIREEFENSQAYAELFEEFFTNPAMAEKFSAGIGSSTKNIKTPTLKVIEAESE